MEIPENKGLMVMGYERIQMREFLIELEKNYGVVSVTCYKIGIARRTFYNWRNQDLWFRNASDEIRKYGKENLDDIAHASMVNLLLKQNVAMTIFYLKTRHPEFMRQPPKKDVEADKNEVDNAKFDSLVKEIKEMNRMLENEDLKN